MRIGSSDLGYRYLNKFPRVGVHQVKAFACFFADCHTVIPDFGAVLGIDPVDFVGSAVPLESHLQVFILNEENIHVVANTPVVVAVFESQNPLVLFRLGLCAVTV